MSLSSVDMITFLLCHPLWPIGHIYRCHAAVTEHMHLVLHSELHQGNYLRVILEFLKKYWMEKANFTPECFYALYHLPPLETASSVSKSLQMPLQSIWIIWNFIISI